MKQFFRPQSFEKKIPPVVLLALHLGVAALLALLPGPKLPQNIAFGCALGLLVSASVIGLLAVIHFAQAKTSLNPMQPEKATALVAHGVFAWSRNPMYLAMALVLVAGIAFFQTLLSLLLLPSFIGLMNNLQIHPEETVLQEKFGSDYRDYCDRVRRWV